MALNQQHRWKVLAAGVAANVSFSCVIGGVPATAVYLRSSYHLSNSELGLALGILGLGIAVSEIPWGLLTDRWGDRPVLLTGLLSVALSLLILAAFSAHTLTAPGLCLGLFAAGLLGSSVNGASGRAIMLWFQERERGLAMSIRQTAVPTGYALGAVLLPWLAHTYGFSVVFATAASLCLLCSGLVWFWIHEPGITQPKTEMPRLSPLRDKQVWRAVLAISVLCAPQFAVLTYAGVYFHDALGLSVTTVSLVLVVIQIGAVVGRLWSGHWTDQHNNRRAYLKGCALFCAVAFAGLSVIASVLETPSFLASIALPIAVILAGIGVSIWHGVAYAELATLAGAQRSGTALSMGNSGVFLGLFLTPIAASATVSHWGWGALWALCAVCGLVAAWLFAQASRAAKTLMDSRGKPKPLSQGLDE
ncbi:MFS transporter [Pseudomonas sp. CCC3.1]|uniref:MFS transporter n=1 Tax=Pseudomonas sp. CCC3.1 TaxID=3048607 RepID=UPI002AC8BE6A|nr:MFS transporter [Pseudomonas sp. CCC3.1]MEB0206175.1 MFS transporter [Pseudomonas sp. CCC3.1]WPX34488.1 MFS transporter [Pseudomonas sp. CCC3.1]